MQPVLGRALGRPVCRRRPVDGYRQNPPSWNAKTRPEDGKTALCINLWHACQSGNMAILLTSLFFVFKIFFLPKYRVNYYDYIIKW